MASEVGNWEWVRELGRAAAPPVGGDFLTRALDTWLRIGQMLLRSQAAQADAREPLAVLSRAERDELREFAAEDAVTIGEELMHAGMRRDFAEIKELQTRCRSMHAVLDALGCDDADDPGQTYAIRGPATDMAPALDRWRDRVDGAMRDQYLGPFAEDQPLSECVQRQINADLETRFRLSNLSTTLTEATRA